MRIEENELILIVGAIALTVFLLGFFFIVVIARYYQSNLKKSIAVFQAMVQTQESERERIGRGLHDQIGVVHSRIDILLTQLKHHIPDKEVSGLLQEMSAAVAEARRESRRVIEDLYPAALEDHGIIKAMNSLAASFKMVTEIILDHDPELETKRFERDVELNLYRILQELINNSIKHSGADRITIQLFRNAQHFSVNYKDNGKGFLPEAQYEGHGLRNILNRVHLYQGTCKFESAPGQGFTAFLTFPGNFLKERKEGQANLLPEH